MRPPFPATAVAMCVCLAGCMQLGLAEVSLSHAAASKRTATPAGMRPLLRMRGGGDVMNDEVSRAKGGGGGGLAFYDLDGTVRSLPSRIICGRPHLLNRVFGGETLPLSSLSLCLTFRNLTLLATCCNFRRFTMEPWHTACGGSRALFQDQCSA